MLKSVHFLLSMSCNYECDHCFLYCSPRSVGTFTSEQLDDVFDQMKRIPGMESVYFEGGEPFLFYPLLLHGMRTAASHDYERGVVTNGYWANSPKDVGLWLDPLAEIGLTDLSISDDSLHHGEEEGTRSGRARNVARKLGLPVDSICLEAPSKISSPPEGAKGEPIVGGDVRFRGRAADKLTAGLPLSPWQSFGQCPDEDLERPARVHVDPFGNIHLCQGLLIGNLWETPLDELMETYSPEDHPICKHLIEGGPAALARAYGFSADDGYVDACHLCYRIRHDLMGRFPDLLGPGQVYGLAPE